MRNLKFKLSYDGTNYNGWQIQAYQENVTTIQGVVQRAAQEIFDEKVEVIGSGRTDAGVHALGQVANVQIVSHKIPAEKVPKALNSFLPEDIRAYDCEEISHDFHARFSAKRKWYRYAVYNHSMPSVFLRNYTFFEKSRLDIPLMREAGNYLRGTHNFSSFCASGSLVKSYLRTVKFLKIWKRQKMIFIDIQADGFLYNMVRIIAGTLLEVGKGEKITPQELGQILESRDRRKAGPTLPAEGLYLIKVFY